METTATTPLSPLPHAKYFYNTSTFHNAIAGFSGGVITTAFLQPLDVVKIRFQVNETSRGGIFRGTWTSLRKIYGNDGMRGLYRGIVPSMWGASLSWGFYFATYDSIKDQMQRYIDKSNGYIEPKDSNDAHKVKSASRLTPAHHLVASTITGILTCFLTNPIWIMKVRFCADSYRDPNAYQTLREGLTKLYKHEGMRGLYRGLVPALMGVSQKSFQFVAYEELKTWRARVKGSGDVNKLDTWDYMGMATTAKVFAMSITYPYQVVRARIQNQRGAGAGVYKSTLGTIRIIYRNEKIAGFYKGMGPNLIRVLPGSVLTFVVYESASKFCRLYLS
ncbi:mitochondrial carrier domain-containing protein [Chytriomyces cf. hyalinus JEL632]|nr:mitochondrial carrier domain-containing protein [Chytriomyces cf. hyalinus JEL632]